MAPIAASALLAMGSAGIPLGGFAAASGIASTFGTIGTVLSGIGTLTSVMGAIEGGNAAKNAASVQSAQLMQRANTERASSQRAAIEERKHADLATSRARALIAGGGGDTTDTGSQKILSGIDTEGEYRGLTALYNGEVAATGSEYGAQIATAQGRAAKRASLLRAGSTLLGSGSSLLDRYSGPSEAPFSEYEQQYGSG